MSFTGSFRALANSTDVSGNQRSVILGTAILTSPTLTYTSIGSNLTQDQTTTVSGASLGDIALVGTTTALVAGLTLTAFVSAANTVTVRIHNATGGSITPGALVFNILVLKP